MTSQAGVILRAHEVSKKYRIRPERSLALGFVKRNRPRDHWALSELDFELRRGEVLAVIGRNGAGKSTLLKIAAGVTTPTTGHIVRPERVAPLIEVGAGFHPDLTGRENIEINGRLLGIGPREIRQVFDDIVEFAELGHAIDQPVRQYSSGMFMRLGFSVAIHTHPDVLIVDEVLAVGDMPFQVRCLERIREMRAGGVGVLFVSHNITAVLTLADRAIFLEAGVLRAEGGTTEVVGAYHQALAESAAEGQDVGAQGVLSDLELVSSSVRDEHGDTPALWEPGQRAVVTMRLRARVDTPTAGLGFTLTKEGAGLVARWLGEEGPLLPPLPAGAEWDVELGLQLNVTEGGYLLDVAIGEPRTRRKVLEHTFIQRFGVVSRLGATGMVDIAPELTMHAAE